MGLFVILLGAITILNPMQPANAGGPSCPPGDVTHSIQHVNIARAGFGASSSGVSFFNAQENCTPNNGPPEFTARANINISGCQDIIVLDQTDFKFAFGLTTLTLDNTSCGDIFVEWHGVGNTLDRNNSSDNGENCNEGKTSFISHSKVRFATATLWVDGEEFDTTVDETDATLEKRTVIDLRCQTGNG